MRTYLVDRRVRRLDQGRVLVGGSPLRLLRLTALGAALIDRIDAGAAVDEAGASGRLLDRLVDGGLVHPCPGPGRYQPGDVTVVIPVRDRPIADLVGLVRRDAVAGVVVVDDGSSPPVEAGPGVTVVRRARSGGPANARNAGLAEVDSPLVAFIDSDGEPAAGWLDPLLAHLDDPAVALVAPRIVGAGGSGVVARYQACRSSLDLGPDPGPIRARTRIGYVPAAALVARVDALRAAGGFDEAMLTGEDVDLLWRLDRAGHRLRYEPAAVVRHHPRQRLGAWLARSMAYGSSAGPLARRHAGAVPAVAMSWWSLAAWTLAVLRQPVAALAVASGTAVVLAGRLGPLPHPYQEAVRLAAAGHLAAGRQLAEAATRPWWPLLVLSTFAGRRVRLVRRTAAAAVILPALVDWATTRPPIDPLRFAGLRLLDDLAYGTGVWIGCARAQTVDPLLPDLHRW